MVVKNKLLRLAHLYFHESNKLNIETIILSSSKFFVWCLLFHANALMWKIKIVSLSRLNLMNIRCSFCSIFNVKLWVFQRSELNYFLFKEKDEDIPKTTLKLKRQHVRCFSNLTSAGTERRKFCRELNS